MDKEPAGGTDAGEGELVRGLAQAAATANPPADTGGFRYGAM